MKRLLVVCSRVEEWEMRSGIAMAGIGNFRTLMTQEIRRACEILTSESWYGVICTRAVSYVGYTTATEDDRVELQDTARRLGIPCFVQPVGIGLQIWLAGALKTILNAPRPKPGGLLIFDSNACTIEYCEGITVCQLPDLDSRLQFVDTSKQTKLVVTHGSVEVDGDNPIVVRTGKKALFIPASGVFQVRGTGWVWPPVQ